MTTKKIKPKRSTVSSKKSKKARAPDKAPLAVTAGTTKVNLCNGIIVGDVKIYLDAEVGSDGLTMSGQDTGVALAGSFGSSDYEYWLGVDREHVDAMLLALIADRYMGDPQGLSRLQTFLDERKIPSSFSSYH